jgi:sugar/nucleoside kinase (ribokinase family)
VRVQYISAVASKIEADEIPIAWRDAGIVYLAPLAGELDASIVHLFPHSLIGVSPQGWLRCWDEEGRVFPKEWDKAEEVLSRADAVVLSEEDVGGDEKVITDFASRTRTLVVTKGSEGATVYHMGEVRHFPAFEAEEIDPTGAGDVFAAAYLIELKRSGDIYKAAVFANCVASISVEKRGTEEIPTLEEVERKLALLGQ